MSIIRPPVHRVVKKTTTLPIALVGLLVILCLNLGNCDPYSGTNNNGGGIHIAGGVGVIAGSESNAGISVSGAAITSCPRVCSCSSSTVDCSHRSLQQVPRRIPLDTERL